MGIHDEIQAGSEHVAPVEQPHIRPPKERRRNVVYMRHLQVQRSHRRHRREGPGVGSMSLMIASARARDGLGRIGTRWTVRPDSKEEMCTHV